MGNKELRSGDGGSIKGLSGWGKLPIGQGSGAGSDRGLNTEGGKEGAHHIWGSPRGIED